MKYIEGQSREQLTFLPECIDDMIGQDNPVRVIDAFIDSLDMEEADFIRYIPKETGRPGYDPRDLLKLYIYGYFNKIRTSRLLMTECTRNVELFFLLKRLTPDFRTISDFRKDNKKAIKNVFNAFVKICITLDLYKRKLLAIDGSKFRAVNSKDNSYNKNVLNRKIKHIDENISKYLSKMDEEDADQDNDSCHSPEEITAIVKDLTDRKDKYKGYLKDLKESGETQKLTTDPEARVMKSRNSFHCCYNVQTAVDSQSHLMADYQVTNQCNDQGLLKTVAESAKKLLDVETIEVVADKGYESRDDIEDCVMNGIIPNVSFKYDKNERLYTIDYEDINITDEIMDSTEPEDIKICLSAGILPTCYEDSIIEVEVQEQNDLSCFSLNEDGTVTCPMGNILSKAKMRGKSTIYQNKGACRQCSNKCTSSKNHKTVSFGPDTKFVTVKMYGDSKYDLNPIPDNIKLNSFNHTLDRTDYSRQKKVVLRIKEDKAKIKERKCLVEHPFGTVKWHHGAHYVLCKGKEKVTAELGLSFLVYNMKRAINMIGTEKLIEAMR